MSPALRIAVAAAALLPCRALADPAAAPDIDCRMRLEALRNTAAWLPGAKHVNEGGRDVTTVEEPDVWRVEITFTAPGDVGHPAVVLRKFVKQVTGVWTAQSKACGYGNPAQFSDLMAAIKAEDSRLTNASRAEVERQKHEQSPLGPP